MKVKNFGAFRHEDLDLSGVHMAVVSGPNGAGKSTLFTDSLLYALYGASRTGNVDDLVRAGEQDMSVDILFLLNGHEYRVVRSRSSKGRGKSVLELYRRNDGDDWQPLSGGSLRETEQRIQELLGVTMDTFTSSCFILQGRLDQFTIKTPAERKKVLADALGLEVYQQLHAAAKEKAKLAGVELEAQRKRRAEINARLDHETALATQRSDLEARLDALTTARANLTSQLDEIKQALARIAAVLAQTVDLTAEDERLARETAELERERTDFEQRLGAAQKLLADEDQILAKAREHATIREQIAVLAAKKPRLEALAAEARQLARERSELETELAGLRAQVRDQAALLANREALELAKADYESAVAGLRQLEKLADQWASLDSEARSAETAWREARQEHDRRRETLEQELRAVRAKTAMLADSNCIDPERAACRFLADAQKAKSRLPALESQLAALDASAVEQLEQTYRNLLAQRDELGYDAGTHRHLKDRVESLRPQADQAANLVQAEKVLTNLKQQVARTKARLQNLQDKYEQAAREGKALQTELGNLAVLQDALTDLAPWLAAKDKLPAARQTVNDAEARLARYREELASKANRRREIAGLLATREQELTARDNLNREAENLKVRLDEIDRERSVNQRELGMFDRSLAEIEELKLEVSSLDETIAATARRQTQYELLARAFDKSGGIPALIIENAVPELEDNANEVLARMTAGAMNVRFETQKELKKGALAETLDIIVSDPYGERPYETFSGGEKFRIDFAIRIALSKLLARKAGASLRLLVLDEGIGSQDADGRERLLEAVRAIEPDFAKILVISHIESIKDAFPTRIQVERGPDGSKVRVG